MYNLALLKQEINKQREGQKVEKYKTQEFLLLELIEESLKKVFTEKFQIKKAHS